MLSIFASLKDGFTNNERLNGMKNIMFNDTYNLTQAVLNGTKTMTRRVLKGNVSLGNWEETAKKTALQGG